MERLWAPWRLEYVKDAAERKEEVCVFCGAVSADMAEEDSLVVHRGPHTITMLNKYPYNNGHLMVAPLRHLAELSALSTEESHEIFRLITHSVKILKKVFNPDGFNIGINLGRSAGAGIVGHLHWHVVPRWNGDTNFMPVLADVKVIPEHLSQTLSTLRPHFEKIE